jgi:chemotaxis protein MotB
MKTPVKSLLLALVATATFTACVSEQTYKKEVSQAQLYQQLNATLSREVASDQAQITQLQNVVKVTLRDSLLFSEGGDKLHASGNALLDQIAPVLGQLTGQKIVVRGYTDNVPIGPELRKTYPTNLALSQARASYVAQRLVADGVPAGIIMTNGFGDADPIASNATAEGRAKNRRVEIEIVPAGN